MIAGTNPAKNREGFTLVEILVVFALIALIGYLGFPSLSNYFKLNLNSIARKMASTIKETYNSSVITGRVHRIVYDLDGGTYWVETGPSSFLLDTPESKEKEERRKRFIAGQEGDPPPAFQMDPTITRTKKELPTGVSFKAVISEQAPEPIIAGQTYTHFFPHGLTEQTILHLEDTENHKMSLVISPLIGRTRVIPGFVTKEDVFGE